MAAYRSLRDLLDAWATPSTPPAKLPACAGAQVVIRLDGKTLGRGGDVVASLAGDRDQLTERAVWRAFLTAFGEADRRLPVANDATRIDASREAAKGVLLSVELAGQPTPISPETFAELETMIVPGVEGVAVRLNNRVESAYPTAMLLSNSTPAEAARALVSKLVGSAETALGEVRDLRDKQKLVFMKFRVTHLAQTAPGEEPKFLFRGGVLADTAALDTTRLRQMADALALHLRGRAVEGDAPLGMRGVYRPWTGEFATPAALPREQALAALALRRYARSGWVANKNAQAAADFADHLLHDLDDVDLDEPQPWFDPADAAMCVLALRESSGAFGSDVRKSHVDLLARCSDRVRASFDRSKGFTPGIAPPMQAAIAAALLRIEGQREVGLAALRQCFKDTQPGALAGMMPLLGWAELEGAAGPIPSAPALRQLRSQLWQNQVTSESAGTDRIDSVGGVAFSFDAPPSWQCLRPLAFCATMLRVPELTRRDEVPGEVVRLVSGSRYLRQLQVDESSVWMTSNAGQSGGGVRSATWDQTMPPDASSTGLLFLCEMLESFEAIKAAK